MASVDDILSKVDETAELEILRYAAQYRKSGYYLDKRMRGYSHDSENIESGRKIRGWTLMIHPLAGY
ncbi:MAG: hypothetical protein AB1611_15915 [bacterium]